VKKSSEFYCLIMEASEVKRRRLEDDIKMDREVG